MEPSIFAWERRDYRPKRRGVRLGKAILAFLLVLLALYTLKETRWMWHAQAAVLQPTVILVNGERVDVGTFCAGAIAAHNASKEPITGDLAKLCL